MPLIYNFFPLPLSKLLPRLPWNAPPNLTQTLQRPVPKLHTTKLNHPRIEAQRRPNIILYPARGIESHDEVVAVVILRLMLAGSFGKGKHAPVFDTTNCTTRSEDKGAGCACDSGGWSVLV